VQQELSEASAMPSQRASGCTLWCESVNSQKPQLIDTFPSDSGQPLRSEALEEMKQMRQQIKRTQTIVPGLRSSTNVDVEHVNAVIADEADDGWARRARPAATMVDQMRNLMTKHIAGRIYTVINAVLSVAACGALFGSYWK